MSVDAGLVWSVALATIGLFGVYLTGRYNSWGWFIGLLSQLLWAAYAVTTGQYGFLISAAAFAYLNARNWASWRHNPPHASTERITA